MDYLCDKEKCENIPLYGIEFDENIVFIDYFCKKHMGKVNLNTFPLNSIDQININSQCKTHKQNYNYYCYDCKEEFCKLCLIHKNHYTTEIIKLSQNEKENIFKKINEFKLYLTELENYKNTLIEISLENIKKINKSFRNYSNIMLIINNFITKLLNFYEKQEKKNEINFNMISNLKIFQFNFEKKYQYENNNNFTKKIEDFLSFCNNFKNIPINSSPLDYELLMYKKEELPNNYKIDLNKMNMIQTLTYNNCINCLLVLKDLRIASASADSYIRIHQLKTFKPILEIKIHNDKVYHLTQLKDSRIVSSSRDFSIKIIKLITPTNFVIEADLKVHTNFVLKTIELFDENLISCSDDHLLIIWKKTNETFEMLKSIQAHEEGIDCVIELSKNKIASFSHSEKLLKFWNISNYNEPLIDYELEVKSFGWNNSLFLLNKNTLLVGNDFIYLISINEPIQIISRIEGSPFGSIIKIKNEQILIGDLNGNLKCYEIKEESLRFCQNKKLFDGRIISMNILDNGSIIMGNSNNSIFIYK